METAAFTPLALFFHAGPLGKAVILLLLAMSVWCWVLIVEAVWSIGRLQRAIRRSLDGVSPVPLTAAIFSAGRDAAVLVIPGERVGERRQRVGEAMHRAAQDLILRAERALPGLAVITSTAPFIGLFGTVWGIMNSFAGIAQAQDTSLATVAPGIAEALGATAIGLAAAIPALVAFNRLGSSLGREAQRLGHLVDATAVSMAMPGLTTTREAE
jgi:biopolymer transport protein ExbB/TolQ